MVRYIKKILSKKIFKNIRKMGSMPRLSIVKSEQQDLYAEPLHRLFEEIAAKNPQKDALIFNEKTCSNTGNKAENSPRKTSYEELNKSANQFARFLIAKASSQHVRPNADGDFIIAVCMQPSDRLIAVLLSIFKAGAAYLPIDPSFPANRVQHILKEAQPILVIRDDDIDGNQFEDSVPTCSASDLYEGSNNLKPTNLNSNEMLANGSKDLSIVLYTSGSTGVPKGVRLPYSVILNRLQWQWCVFPYENNENVCVFKTALTFVDSISELWGPLLCGLTILVVPKYVTKDPELLVNILEEYKIRRLVLVPTLLRSMLMYLKMTAQRKQLENLNIWVCSGEPLPVGLVESFYDYFDEGVHRLCNFYGSTEVMGDVTYFLCESKKQLSLYERVPIGKPVFNTVIYLLDPDFRPVKVGEIGEIFVAGLNLAEGYVNGRDADRFVENPLAVELKYSRIYRTGDYGYLTTDGNIIYEGRKDSQIKVRGHRVDIAEIEKQISDMEMVDKVIVLCYHYGQIDQALLAFVKLRDDSPLINELQLEAKLKHKLGDYMMPQVILTDHIPLLVNGKVDRQALLKSYETTNNNIDDTSIVLEFDYTGVPEEQKEIAKDFFETVGSVIGRSTRAVLALNSNFYELGGNSLNSIYTVTLLREKGYHISITDFITAKNLGEILNKIAINGSTKPDSSNMNDLINACPYLSMETFPLEAEHRDMAIKIIVDSFYGKADLEQWLKPDIYPTDYSDLITDIWDALVEKNLSFIVRDRNTGKFIGTALNFDARDEPEVEVKSKLQIIFEFLEYLEGPIRDNYLPKGSGKILHSFMMGTDVSLNARENIACMNFMESQVLEVAKSRSFAGILTTNTNPLTQQLGNEVYQYKTLLDYQVNEFVASDGTRPFFSAPNTQRAIVHWKEITY